MWLVDTAGWRGRCAKWGFSFVALACSRNGPQRNQIRSLGNLKKKWMALFQAFWRGSGNPRDYHTARSRRERNWS